MGTHPIFESDFDCLTEMAETDKPSVLEARLQAARERRQRQEKERADRKTERRQNWKRRKNGDRTSSVHAMRRLRLKKNTPRQGMKRCKNVARYKCAYDEKNC